MSDATPFCSHCGAPNAPSHSCDGQAVLGLPTTAHHPGVAQPSYTYPAPPTYSHPQAPAPRQGPSVTLFAVVGALVGVLIVGGLLAVMALGKESTAEEAAPVAATAPAASPTKVVAPEAAKPAPTVTRYVSEPRVVEKVVTRSSDSVRGFSITRSPGARCATTVGSVYNYASAANSSVSCAFVGAVGRAYSSTGSDDLYSVYSTVTGQYYKMTCTDHSGSRVICTGGNNAAVWIY